VKRTPLKRKTPLKRGLSQLSRKHPENNLRKSPLKSKGSTLKRTSKLKQRSKKRVKEEAEYSRLRREFLNEHPKCEGCLWEWYNNPLFGKAIAPSTEIQHKALRGKYYLRTDTWAAVCREHGERCTVDNPWAYESGLRLTRGQIRNLS
jgi:hypothetical protein